MLSQCDTEPIHHVKVVISWLGVDKEVMGSTPPTSKITTNILYFKKKNHENHIKKKHTKINIIYQNKQRVGSLGRVSECV
jgi:hypothetical protein